MVVKQVFNFFLRNMQSPSLDRIYQTMRQNRNIVINQVCLFVVCFCCLLVSLFACLFLSLCH